MQRLFVTLKSFWSDWVRLDLNDDDLSDLEDELLESPEAGKLLRETGGVRKVRFARGGVGKRGGVRVFYLDFSEQKKITARNFYRKAGSVDSSAETTFEIGGTAIRCYPMTME